MDMVKTQPPANWVWTHQREQAASLLALDQLTDNEIAAQVGIDRNTLWLWKKSPEFAGKVRSLAELVHESVMQQGIAIKANRVRHLNERYQKLRQVVDERAAHYSSHEDPEVRDAPGVTTGLLVRQIRMIGTGRAAREVVEFVVDTTLLREMRAIEEHTAREMGQWTDKNETAVNVKAYINIDMDRL